MIIPLGPGEISATHRGSRYPAARLALALAAVHARPEAIRTLALSDLDLGDRRIALAGQSRQLDDLTRRFIFTWPDHRRARGPQGQPLPDHQ